MDINIRSLLLKRFIELMDNEITEFKKSFSNIEFQAYPGEKFHMISAGGRGIYKPKNSPYALSIRCEQKNSTYNDQIFFDAKGAFEKMIYHGPVSKKLQNRAQNDIDSLIACYEDKIPFGIILGMDKNKSYQSLGLGIIKSHKDNKYEIIPYDMMGIDQVNTNNVDDELFSPTDILSNKVTEKIYNLKVRTAQSEFRRKLLKKQKKCLLCDINFEPLLIASHIKAWSVSNDIERLDFNNGFLLCPLHDKLFDNGYISFENNELILSSLLDDTIPTTIKHRKFKFNSSQINYLNYHRNNIFKTD